MGASRASDTNALKSLAEHGLIHYEPYSFVTMAESGEVMVAEIIRRPNKLREVFESIFLPDPEKSEANSCRAEHAMDVEAVDRLVPFLEFFKECPSRAGHAGSVSDLCKDRKKIRFLHSMYWRMPGQG